MSWTAMGSDDGFLAFDHNGNGVVDDGGELFGSATPQPQNGELNGFRALATFDKPESGGNGDGMIDALDAVFAKLWVWVDRNHNGVSEPDELVSLPQADIHSIDLHYQTHRFVDENGNQSRWRSKVRGSKYADPGKWAYDVILVIEGGNSAANQRSGRLQAKDSKSKKPAPDTTAANPAGCRKSL